MLCSLLADILNLSSDRKILIVIIDDGSIPLYNLSKFNLKYIRLFKNNGKKKYYNVFNESFKFIKYIDAEYFIYLPDDIRLKKSFFTEAIKIFNLIGKENILLSLLIDKSRKYKPQWVRFTPVEFRSYYQTQWTDLCFICKKNIFEALNYFIEPIPLNRWNTNQNKSSGVGQQISIRLNELNFELYHVKRTLVIHGDHESRMNKEERKLHPLIT